MRRALSVVGVVALASCVHRFGGPTGPALRLEASPDVRWEEGQPHELAVVLVNDGSAPLAVPEPVPARVAVSVFPRGERTPSCLKNAAAPSPTDAAVELRAHERRAILVRLPGCDLPPGEYRYEASFARGATAAERVGPEVGTIVVRPATSLDLPASPRAVSPLPPSEPPAGPVALPEPQLRPEAPTLGPESAACVARELERRGLNAYGDPAGTIYPGGPPTLSSDVELQRMIMQRYPELGTVCRMRP